MVPDSSLISLLHIRQIKAILLVLHIMSSTVKYTRTISQTKIQMHIYLDIERMDYNQILYVYKACDILDCHGVVALVPKL